MQKLQEPRVWVRLAILFFVIAISGISPQSRKAAEALREANLALESNDPAEAAKWLSTAAEHMPQRADLWEFTGHQALLANDSDAAVNYFLAAAELNKLSLEGQIALGKAYRETGEIESAINVWVLSLDADNAPSELYWLIGLAFSKNGNYPTAASHLEIFVANEPSNAAGHFELGLLLAVLEPRSASAHLLLASQLDSEYENNVVIMQSALHTAQFDNPLAYVHTVIGQSLGIIERWDLAAESFRIATEHDATFAEAWAYLGEAKQKNGLEGFAELEVAWALNPDSLSANILLSHYWQRQNDMEQALEYLQLAVTLEPRNPALQSDLGSLYLRLGDLEEARAHYIRATALRPQIPDYWILLAEFSIEHDLYLQESGLPAAQKAYALSPNDPYIITLLGRAHHSLGEFDLAMNYFTQVLSQFPDYPPAHLHLGLLYIDQDNLSAAQQEFLLVIQLAPESQSAMFAEKLLVQYFP